MMKQENFMASNRKKEFISQNTSHFNIMGNSNTISFTRCKNAEINLMGNANKIYFSNGSAKITINGNGNTFSFQNSLVTIPNINGNANDFSENMTQIQYYQVNGFGNSLPSSARQQRRRNREINPQNYHQNVSNNQSEVNKYFRRVPSSSYMSSQGQSYCPQFQRRQENIINNGNGTYLLQIPSQQSQQFDRRMPPSLFDRRMPPPLFQQRRQQPFENRIPYSHNNINSERREERRNYEYSQQENKLITQEQLNHFPIGKPSQRLDRCIICLQDIDQNCKIVYLPCLHYFHFNCCKDWFKKSVECPLCKTNVRNQLRNN